MRRLRQKIFPLLLAAGVFSLVLGAPGTAWGQSFNLDLGDGPTSTGRLIQIFLLLTVLSLAPSILVMVTSFTRIVVVLSFLRTAMGAQQTPPNQVMVALALFLTFFVMMPVLEASWEQGIRPLIEGKIDEGEAFKKASAPVHAFMMKHVREQDLRLFMDAANTPQVDGPEAVPLRALVPAFMISELRRAFEIGFLVFHPVSRHRYGGGIGVDVDGHDDAATDHHRVAVQDHILRPGGRLVPDRRQPD